MGNADNPQGNKTMTTATNTITKADAIELLGNRNAHLEPERLRYLAKFTNDTDVYRELPEFIADVEFGDNYVRDFIGVDAEDPGYPKKTYAGTDVDYKEFCRLRAIDLLVEDPTLLDPIDPEDPTRAKDVKLRKLQDKVNETAALVFENVYHREPVEKLVENEQFWDRFFSRNLVGENSTLIEKRDKYGEQMGDYFDPVFDENYCAREAMRIVNLYEDTWECWTPIHYDKNASIVDVLACRHFENPLADVEWLIDDDETCYGTVDGVLDELYLDESTEIMEQHWRDKYPECKFTRHKDYLIIEYLTDNTRLPYACDTGYGTLEQWQSFANCEILGEGLEIYRFYDALARCAPRGSFRWAWEDPKNS
jgi:hypothetical protein